MNWTQEEILEYNKRCADFLGWRYDEDLNHFIDPINRCFSTVLYHSDWNWIMEVVDAIEELDIIASFQIEQPTIYIWKSSETSTFEDISIDIFTMSKKEAVVQAINKFLIWYNNEQKT